ncbi:putative shewanella-like protein phosphatase 2 [Cocos nucifera]|uniref:Putative shewanella-like protein phosphatase 2 n=1 Tax=Cocos nucifera TaxID=13894 RepID=A0A8K0IPE9_COCNU|nr:putative shewanella-like protein phosphatase 2 [Cocos nucifera]
MIKAVEERVKLIEARAKVEKAKGVIEAKLKDIKEFRAFEEFKNEVAEGSSVVYEYGFEAYKEGVARLLLGVNLSHL